MILSEKHNFIFIAVPKTGTTSIHDVFGKIGDESIYIEKVNKGKPGIINPSIFKHITGSALKKEISNYDKYFTFGFVRNSWDRLVSLVHYEKYSLDIDSLEIFPEYFWRLQYDWLFDGSESMVDFVGRYENFQEDFNLICDRIGVSRIQCPHRNASKHKFYTSYCDNELREIVAKRFAKDIEFFGYEFGE